MTLRTVDALSREFDAADRKTALAEPTAPPFAASKTAPATAQTDATRLLDMNRCLTVGTVGLDGRPWTSPVFASEGERVFYSNKQRSWRAMLDLFNEAFG